MLFNSEVYHIIRKLEHSQWTHRPDMSLVDNLPVITRDDIRAMNTVGLFKVKTSGSTGESLSLWKSYQDALWYSALTVREIIWKRWDPKLDICTISGTTKTGDHPDWALPRMLYPEQGQLHSLKLTTTDVIQQWLEKCNPHYIFTYPSILSQLDLTRIPNFIDSKNTGEAGSSVYSSEECGYISIQCPDNPLVQHVVENVIVEQESDGAALITSLSNPYIKRYRIGDYIELGTCSCGRTLQTITKIHGRVRNLITYPNGTKQWPTVGSPYYYDKFNIRRFQAIQTSIDDVTIKMIRDHQFTEDQHLTFVKFVQESLHHPFNITVEYVNSFPPGKFEEFKSLL